jgi:streptomycin 6-kinase
LSCNNPVMPGDRNLSFDDWYASVPDRLEWCRTRWGLTLGDPFSQGAAGYVVRARCQDGPTAILKLRYPHRESEDEASALAEWDGEGAVRLLANDDEVSAMLLEKCDPGTPLSAAPAQTALGVIANILPRLWIQPTRSFRALAEEAAWWVGYLPNQWAAHSKPFPRQLLDTAIDALTTLAPSQGDQVLVHQDLHSENVLAAQREPWLVIDPKPLVGEREFALAPVIRVFELGHSRRAVLDRLDRLTSDLGLDRQRAAGWAIGQTLAWAFDSDYHAEHIQTASWLTTSW